MKRFLVFCLAWSAPVWSALPVLTGVDLAQSKPVTLTPNDKTLVIAFLSSKCPCSHAHETILRSLVKAHPEVTFVGVHSNSDEPTVQAAEYFRAANLPFPVLQDEHSALANQYGALKTPHVFVLSAAGALIFRGGIDDSRHPEHASHHYLADTLAALSEHRLPQIHEARALGCVIAR